MKKYKLVLPSQPRESVLSTKLESFYDRELLEGARMFNSGKQVHFREYTPLNVQMENNNADVVEVVRCKDCAVPHNKWLGCPHLNGKIPPPDFYCARGERRKE